LLNRFAVGIVCVGATALAVGSKPFFGGVPLSQIIGQSKTVIDYRRRSQCDDSLQVPALGSYNGRCRAVPAAVLSRSMASFASGLPVSGIGLAMGAATCLIWFALGFVASRLSQSVDPRGIKSFSTKFLFGLRSSHFESDELRDSHSRCWYVPRRRRACVAIIVTCNCGPVPNCVSATAITDPALAVFQF
jgi:hypothetical protein